MPRPPQAQTELEALDSPAQNAFVITPDDNNDLVPFWARSLYIGGAGNINLDTWNGDTALFSNLPSGSVLPVATKRVRVTGTTATLIVALY